jgi:hypothetical protein
MLTWFRINQCDSSDGKQHKITMAMNFGYCMLSLGASALWLLIFTGITSILNVPFNVFQETEWKY